MWANFHYWAELLREARRTPRLADRLRLFVKPPGWRPVERGGSIPAPEVDRASYRKFDTPLTRRRAAYVFVHFAAILTASAALLYTQARLPLPVLLAGPASCS